MGRRLYVGNLPYKATDEDLMALFRSVGDVASARVMRDMATGRARGFGFVEMTTDEAAQKAIEKLHQHEMDGRAIVVNEAQPKPMAADEASAVAAGSVAVLAAAVATTLAAVVPAGVASRDGETELVDWQIVRLEDYQSDAHVICQSTNPPIYQ